MKPLALTHMNIATTEMKRSKTRFGLLTAAVALLIFLVLLLTTLSNALVSSLVGALESLRTDGLVYSDTARDNIVASRLAPATVAQVAAVPGVASAAGIGTFTTRTALAGVDTDIQVVGFNPQGPGTPDALSSGRLPTMAQETAVDGGGLALGDRVALTPGGSELTVVGLLRGAQFNASPTLYVDLEAYDEAVRAANPGLPFVPLNAVAFEVEPGQDVAAVAAAVDAAVTGVTAYPKSEAVALIPGIDSISQSFGILVGLTFIIGIVVIGFFFLILTVQKLKAFTLLRAIGTSTRRLSAMVALQIVLVVLVASAIAVGLTLLAVQGLNTGIPVTLDPTLIIGVVVAVLVFSLLAGMLSIRRIAKIDPATAVGAR